MAAEFRLADIGEGLTEAEVVRWLVSAGDTIEVDQPLVEVETAKSIVELPSPYAGTVLQLGAPDGAVIQVGELIAAIGDVAESRLPNGPARSDPVPVAPPEKEVQVAPIVGSLSEDALELAPIGRAVAPKVRAVPLVRKLAQELGVDLSALHGSGPQGRITRKDVHAAVPGPAAAPKPAADVRRPDGMRRSGADDEIRPLSVVRRTIAANLGRAWSEIPMVSAFDDIDVGRLLSVRKALARHYDRPVPLDAMLVSAVVPVLREYPEFNSSLKGDSLVVHGRHDIGLAVDTPDGLMVAVISDASSKSLYELAGEVVRLGQAARKRKLGPAELTGQTFTVSNIGAVGGSGYGTPLVPPGTTAILSVGRAMDKPVARDGRFEIAPLMPVSLSYDHRVIDGALGRRFLARLSELLTEPALLLA